ncbi:MAG: rod shape-determining protein RodA [Pseudomonadota bacterium]
MNEILQINRRKGFQDRLAEIDWVFISVITIIAGVGVGMLYSVADGAWRPWALSHALRFTVGLALMIGIALINLRFWMSVAYPIYAVALGLLLCVEFFGLTIMGAQRWIMVGPVQLQPSEIMKIALVLALARYYHGLRVDQVSHWLFLIPPLLMIGAPVFLVANQPDLGTSLLLAAGGAIILFLAGLSWWIVLGAVGASLAAIPIAIKFVLKDYQLERVMTFLNPERDPMGEGYHLLQSKIALGSGGVGGKGYLQGTQSHLNFLPEMQTDFIFTMYGEEFGLIGAAFLLILYACVFLMGLNIAMSSKSHFGRLVAMGVVATFSLYVLINTAMVMGLAPVVGVPLPLVSYGGTVLLTIMVGFGLVMSVHVHRDQDTLRSGDLL